MKLSKIAAVAIMSVVAAVSAFAQNDIPEGRQLYVGAWKFAVQNKMQEGYVNVNENKYEFKLMQTDKGLLGYSTHIFDVTINGDGASFVLDLVGSVTGATDKDGNLISTSSWKKGTIMNKSAIVDAMTKDVMKYLTADDAVYEGYVSDVISDVKFLSFAAANMTELALDDFVETNKIYDRPATLTLTVYEVRKNDGKYKDYPYQLTAFEGKNIISVYSRDKSLIRAKKDSQVTVKGKYVKIDINNSLLPSIDFIAD
jgi:hypothetical protein